MNPKTNRRSHSERQHPEAKQGRVPLTGYPENFQNVYGLGMTQAAEFAKTACSTAVCLNSCLMDVCRHFFWYPFGLEFWFEGQNRAFATWMNLGTQLLGLQAPHGERTPAPVDQSGLTPEELAAEIEEEIEEMEEGMDVAVEAFEEEILA